MKMISYIAKKLERLPSSRSCLFTWFHLRGNQFSFELLYFLFRSYLGFLILHSLDGKTTTFTPRNLDLFFTSVSAATVSSMSTVEMEVFSNAQLIIMTIMMFLGGEVFTSMVTHYIRTFFINVSPAGHNKVHDCDTQCNFSDKIELKDINILEFGNSKSANFYSDIDLKCKSLKFLGGVVLFYLVFVHFLGVVSVLIYLNVISSAKNILKLKGLHSLTFSMFTIVSTFANCGFVPTNENMLVFRTNSGLLLILIVQILLGNTLYPLALRFSIWAIGKFVKKSETRYLLKNSKGMEYDHLHSYLNSSLLLITVLVFIMVQFILFSSMEWSSESLSGMNVYQKLVGILFQTVNTRHSGESIVNLSTVSSAVLVLFVLMMYLPPYTSFLPISEESSEQGSKRVRRIMENMIFSQQIYLVIFITLVCITESKQMVDDPRNFNVLNIVVEVVRHLMVALMVERQRYMHQSTGVRMVECYVTFVQSLIQNYYRAGGLTGSSLFIFTSAYGNVGFSTGYNCDRRLKQDGDCQNKWYGFSGKCSDEGKLVLIIVMMFGRLKKFNKNGGKAWKVL